jgi:hypothetical protein
MTQIVIDLGEVWSDEKVAADAIVDRAAKMLVDSHELRTEVRRRVDKLADDEILRWLGDLIEEALTEPLQPTDAFGSPMGEPTTLRDLILKRVEKELSTEKSRSTFRNSRNTLLTEIVEREVLKVVGDDLRETMNVARTQVREAVQAKGAEVLAETIQRLAR